MKAIFDNVHKNYRLVADGTEGPSGRVLRDYDFVPEGIRDDVSRLQTVTNNKYERQHLKVCAFYNKMFPSQRLTEWFGRTADFMPFTAQYQEHADGGTGLSSNYLKNIIDTITSRLGNTKFDYKLLADQPTLLYAIYKDEIERIFRAVTKQFNLNTKTREAFHDAAILAFSHMFVDPYTKQVRKIPDWGVGAYESEFASGKLKRCAITEYSFPLSELQPYVAGRFTEQTLDAIKDKHSVELCIYIDCFRHKSYVLLDGSMCSEGEDYPFDEVLLSTFSWDVGVRRVTVSSLFDLLFPLQRQLDKFLEKKGELMKNYKGPVPIFNQDCDIIVKQISNATGECLFLDQKVPSVDAIMTVLDPTPLDPNIDAAIDALKSQMFELAGIQQISMDLENYRSAAAVLAMDQIRDAAFQSQLAALSDFVRDTLEKYVLFCSVVDTPMPGQGAMVDWGDIYKLITECYLKVEAIHDNDQTGGGEKDPMDLDYVEINTDKFIKKVLTGEAQFDDIDFTLDYNKLKLTAANKLLRLKAITDGAGDELDNLTVFLVACFVEDVKRGEAQL